MFSFFVSARPLYGRCPARPPSVHLLTAMQAAREGDRAWGFNRPTRCLADVRRRLDAAELCGLDEAVEDGRDARPA